MNGNSVASITCTMVIISKALIEYLDQVTFTRCRSLIYLTLLIVLFYVQDYSEKLIDLARYSPRESKHG